MAKSFSARTIIDPHTGWRDRRRNARQLQLRDQTNARLAELDQIACILNDAADLVPAGWLRDNWFVYRDDIGRARPVNAYNTKQWPAAIRVPQIH
jgi:hypothetical protein